jgi:hypothetical protein
MHNSFFKIKKVLILFMEDDRIEKNKYSVSDERIYTTS